MTLELRSALTALLPRLRRFGLAITGSRNDADDLVQAACERVLLRGDQLRDQTRMDAWIYGIMRNLWFDEVRFRKIRRHDDISEAADIIGEDGEAVAEGRITLAAVRAAMAGMSEDRRTLLMLVCVDGLTYQEAADTLGIAIGTVMSRLSRARRELQERLNERERQPANTPIPFRRGGK